MARGSGQLVHQVDEVLGRVVQALHGLLGVDVARSFDGDDHRVVIEDLLQDWAAAVLELCQF